jgi:hypothetical protein
MPRTKNPIKDSPRMVSITGPTGEIEITSNYYYKRMQIENDLLAKYRDYDQMDNDLIEITSALDIYADNTVSGGNNLDREYQVVLSKPDKKAQKVIDEMERTTEIRDIIWNMARSVLKYGNWYLELIPRNNKIVRIKELPVKEMRIEKDKYGRLLRIYQKSEETGMEINLDVWKCVHLSMNRPYTYGQGLLNRLRRISRQLRLCEDALVVARLTKATQKIIYKVDVTGMSSTEALAYIRKWKANMRKRRILNPITGEIISDFNPIRDEEDIYLPVKQNSPTDVTPLAGDANIADIADIEFLQNRLFAGLKLPKAYMGFEGDTHNRNVITALDIQFARQVRRIQKVLVKGLRHIYDIAFIMAGFELDKLDYKIVFPTISTIDELTAWQVNQTKLTVAQLILGLGISLPDAWILGNLMELPKDEVEAIIEYTAQVEKEQKEEEARLAAQQTAEEVGFPGTAGGVPPEEGEGTEKLTPEDVDRLNSVGKPIVERIENLLKSNPKLYSMVGNITELLEWKREWSELNGQLDAIFNKLYRK